MFQSVGSEEPQARDIIKQSGPPRWRGLFRGIAWPAILCHKEPASSKQNNPQCNGGILRSKARSRGIWMPELVLYGIRLLAPASLGKLSTNESQASTSLDQ